MNFTIDSSVIVASLREQEGAHQKSKAFMTEVIEGEHTAYESTIVPVEVTAAIRRRTGSRKLARQVKQNLLNLDSFIFCGLSKSRMESAARIAEKVSLKGMDAIITQIAQEKDTSLVTLDKELKNKAKSVVEIQDMDEVL